MLWAVLLLTVGAVLAAMFWPAPKRPTYEGKTVEEWLLQLDPRSGHSVEYERAWYALARMDATALPEIERILSQRPNKWRERWNGWKVRLHLAKPEPWQPLEQMDRAGWAAYLLADCGKVDISPLLPHLTFHATNLGPAGIWRAIASAGDEGISVLTNLVFTGELPMRLNAAWGLQFVRQKPQAIAALLRSAKIETNSPARASILGYLAGSGAPADEAVPLGLRLLRSEDVDTRWQATCLLADYRSIVEVSNALQAALSNVHPSVRDSILGPLNR